MVDEQLENDLIEVINRHISERNIHPQAVSETLASMSVDTLGYLAWLPQSLQSAKKYLELAIDWYSGIGVSVLTHQVDQNGKDSIHGNELAGK